MQWVRLVWKWFLGAMSSRGGQGIVAGSVLAFFFFQLDLPGNTLSLLFPQMLEEQYFI